MHSISIYGIFAASCSFSILYVKYVIKTLPIIVQTVHIFDANSFLFPIVFFPTGMYDNDKISQTNDMFHI